MVWSFFWYGSLQALQVINGARFVHETEEQVVTHLEGHLDKLSTEDKDNCNS